MAYPWERVDEKGSYQLAIIAFQVYMYIYVFLVLHIIHLINPNIVLYTIYVLKRLLAHKYKCARVSWRFRVCVCLCVRVIGWATSVYFLSPLSGKALYQKLICISRAVLLKPEAQIAQKDALYVVRWHFFQIFIYFYFCFILFNNPTVHGTTYRVSVQIHDICSILIK